MSPLLSVRDLVKHYGSGPSAVRAVNGLSFDVKPGICFGLLGPNGAGKTTTIEMMEGINQPTSGEVLYKGEKVGKNFRNEVGIQFQQTAIQDLIHTREVLQLFSSFYEKTTPIETLIEVCQLGDFLNREPRRLSGGQRQRVLLALALVNDPELVFLDEPTTGLDPQARRNFWDLVEDIKSRGKTLILTTHYMEEAERLCDEIAIIDKGKLLAQGTPEKLIRENFTGSMLTLPRTVKDGAQAALKGLSWRESADTIETETTEVGSDLGKLVTRGVSLNGLLVKAPTLEDLFLKLTGRNLRE